MKTGNTPLIEFRNTTVVLNEKKALDALSLVIPRHENVAIIGPNGSGKSTFIKTVSRSCYPRADDGSCCRILGQDTWNIFDLRYLLGIVSNELQAECMRELPARDVVLSGFFSSIGLFTNHRITAAMERKTADILSFLEIARLEGTNMTEMSSGEARRVLIGRALVHDPDALLLDEPTTSLDLHAIHRFRESLRKIARSGKSIILVTHHLHDIIPEIRRVVLMKDGKVVKDGPKDKLLTAKNLSELFSVDLEIREKNGYYHAF